jgi:tetratricopeptide (TPR) repeat protein
MSIPTNYIKKRDLLHNEKTAPQTLSQVGREFLALERYSDALDFFEKAKDLSALNEIKQLAVKMGDAFLLSRLDRYDRTLVSKEEWDEAAKQARADGRESMAEFVARKFPPPEAAEAALKPVALPGAAPLSEN